MPARRPIDPMTKMIVANLVHRPIRSLISIFAIAIEVTLILVIVASTLFITWREQQASR